MNILSVHQQLSEAGFPMPIAEIQALIKALNGAIVSGKVRQSTAPDQNRYPMRQVLQFLRDKDNEVNYLTLWNKAIELCPQLADFKVFASYSQNVTQQKQLKSGVLSLTPEGIVMLAAVLGLKPTKQYPSVNTSPQTEIEATDETIDPRIPIRDAQIYVLQDIANKVLKVGVTNDIETRMMQHKSSNPFLVPIAFFPVTLKSQESALHQLLKPYRVLGLREWYTDSSEVRRLISDQFFTIS